MILGRTVESAASEQLEVHRVFFQDVRVAERETIHLIVSRCACKVVLRLANGEFNYWMRRISLNNDAANGRGKRAGLFFPG